MTTIIEIKESVKGMETILINTNGDTFTISHFGNRNNELLDFLDGCKQL